MQTSDPDARLMLAFRAGDEDALAELYRRWAGPILRFLERMVRERATAEELMQETFVRVHGARDRYVAEARFSTWLFRIARNLALNELDRTRNRAPHLTAEGPDDVHRGERGSADRAARPALSLVAGGASVDALVDARRASSRLEAALAELPERQRSALWLAAVEGHSYEEIAAVLETTIASVKSLVHRARVNLAERIDEAERPATGANEAKKAARLKTQQTLEEAGR